MEKVITNQQIFQAAKIKWGERAQMIVALEELAECSVAIAKKLNGKLKDNMDLITEIADVEIMLDQVKWLNDWDAAVAKEKRFKLNRVAKITGLVE